MRPSPRVGEHRDSIRALVVEHHAVAPRVFGSVARGDDEPGSDLAVTVCDVLARLVPAADTFADDVRTQWAVEMGLIGVGEAVDRVPDDVLARFAEQPWRQVGAVRNPAAHQYDDLAPGRL